jgi:hypothetical protein
VKKRNRNSTRTVSADVEVGRMRCLTRPSILRLFQASTRGREVCNAVNPETEKVDLRPRVVVQLSEEDCSKTLLAKSIKAVVKSER